MIARWSFLLLFGAWDKVFDIFLDRNEIQVDFEQLSRNIEIDTSREYVDSIISRSGIQMGMIQSSIERKLYEKIVVLTTKSIRRMFLSIDHVEFFNHHITLVLEKNSNSATDDGIELEMESKMEQRLDAFQCNHDEVEELVNSMISQRSFRVRWIPDEIERHIYFNSLLVTFSTVQAVIGDPIQIDITTFILKLARETRLKRKKMKSKWKSQISEEHVNSFVAQHLKGHILQPIEFPLYKSMAALLLCTLEEIVGFTNLSFLGQEFKMKVSPFRFSNQTIDIQEGLIEEIRRLYKLPAHQSLSVPFFSSRKRPPPSFVPSKTTLDAALLHREKLVGIAARRKAEILHASQALKLAKKRSDAATESLKDLERLIARAYKSMKRSHGLTVHRNNGRTGKRKNP